MNNYRITVQHDKGQSNITVTATDSATACNMVMQAENCPARAILNVVQCSPVIKQDTPMKRFTATLQHDKGIVKIIVAATDISAARAIIKEAEKCPDSAILLILPCKPGRP